MESVLKTYRLARRSLGEILSAIEFMDDTCMTLVEDVFSLQSPIAKYPFYMLVEVTCTFIHTDFVVLFNTSYISFFL